MSINEISWGLLIGLVSSAIVSVAIYFIVNKKNKKELRKKYGQAHGDYIGYGFEPIDENDPKAGHKDSLGENPISKAQIRYLRDNVLSITLEEDNLIWKGEILMELETLGSVTWRYSNLPDDNGKEQHRFGLKRCIIRNEPDNNLIVYLMGEKGYDEEVLIRE